MPVMDGIEMCEIIMRMLGEGTIYNVEIVVMSGG